MCEECQQDARGRSSICEVATWGSKKLGFKRLVILQRSEIRIWPLSQIRSTLWAVAHNSYLEIMSIVASQNSFGSSQCIYEYVSNDVLLGQSKTSICAHEMIRSFNFSKFDWPDLALLLNMLLELALHEIFDPLKGPHCLRAVKPHYLQRR